jgi:hypothetical protein
MECHVNAGRDICLYRRVSRVILSDGLLKSIHLVGVLLVRKSPYLQGHACAASPIDKVRRMMDGGCFDPVAFLALSSRLLLLPLRAHGLVSLVTS